jgi:hypothetical protein
MQERLTDRTPGSLPKRAWFEVPVKVGVERVDARQRHTFWRRGNADTNAVANA